MFIYNFLSSGNDSSSDNGEVETDCEESSDDDDDETGSEKSNTPGTVANNILM